MAIDPERFRLEPQRHLEIFERFIRPHLFNDVAPAARPVAVVFGGQPGSGKSMAVEEAVSDLGGSSRVARIIGDELRAYHPTYARLLREDDQSAAAFTDRDSGRWVEMAIEAAQDAGVNVVIEGTMRSPDKVAATMRGFRENGYQVEARVLAVPHRVSWQSVLLRYEAQRADRGHGRMTTPEAHQLAFDGLPVTLQRIEDESLADRMLVLGRGGRVLLDGVEPRGGVAAAVVAQERTRPFEIHEHRLYLAGYQRVLGMMAERGAGAGEIARVEERRKLAEGGLLAAVFLANPERLAVGEFPQLASAYRALQSVSAALPGGPTAVAAAAVSEMARIQIARELAAGRIPSAEALSKKQVRAALR